MRSITNSCVLLIAANNTSYKSTNTSLKLRLSPVVSHKVLYWVLFFFVYVNDISYSSNQMNFFPFADDTNLLYAEKNLSSLEVTANKELAIVCNWLLANVISQHKENKFCNFPAIPETDELRRYHKTL